MISKTSDITVEPLACMSAPCTTSECSKCNQNEQCTSTVCDLCFKCLDNEKTFHMHRTYRENIQKGKMKRIFPSSNHFNEDCISKLSTANQFQTRWLQAKCKADKTWC